MTRVGIALAEGLERLLRGRMSHCTVQPRFDRANPRGELADRLELDRRQSQCYADLVFQAEQVVIWVFDGRSDHEAARFQYCDPGLVEQLEQWCLRYDRAS